MIDQHTFLNSTKNNEEAESFFRNEIHDNEVRAVEFNWQQGITEGDNLYSALKCGIHVENSNNATISYNTVEKAMRQFHFHGNDEGADFKCNTMGEGRFGLHCSTGLNSNGSTDMSDQSNKGNIWSTNANFYSFGAKYADTQGLPFKFEVNPAIPGNQPPTWTPFTWFTDIQLIPDCGVEPQEQNPRYLSWLDTMILSGNDPNLEEAVRWDNKRMLIRLLLDAPAAQQEHNNAANWLNMQSGTSAWQFVMAEYALSNAMALPAPLEDSLRGLDTLEYLWSEGLYQVLLDLDTMPADSVSLFSQLDSVYTGLEYVLELDDSMRAGIDSSRLIKLQLARDTIEMLPDTSAWEWARKQIFLWTADCFIGISPTSVMQENLRNIALACVDSVASASESARLTLPEDSTIAYIGEGQIMPCIALRGEQRLEIDYTEALIKIRIQPNPAHDQILITADTPVFLEAWQITDAAGKIVRSGKNILLPELISLAGMNPGYYFFRGQDVNGHIVQSKLIIHSK